MTSAVLAARDPRRGSAYLPADAPFRVRLDVAELRSNVTGAVLLSWLDVVFRMTGADVAIGRPSSITSSPVLEGVRTLWVAGGFEENAPLVVIVDGQCTHELTAMFGGPDGAVLLEDELTAFTTPGLTVSRRSVANGHWASSTMGFAFIPEVRSTHVPTAGQSLGGRIATSVDALDMAVEIAGGVAIRVELHPRDEVQSLEAEVRDEMTALSRDSFAHYMQVDELLRDARVFTREDRTVSISVAVTGADQERTMRRIDQSIREVEAHGLQGWARRIVERGQLARAPEYLDPFTCTITGMMLNALERTSSRENPEFRRGLAGLRRDHSQLCPRGRR